MSNQKPTLDNLREMQAWPLERKVAHAIDVISTFVNRRGGLDKVYISCSFGKDSLVLLDIAKRVYPDILAVFCNTGMEHPSVIKMANSDKSKGGNLKIIRPTMKVKEVFANYGFPLVSKESSFKIHYIRLNPNSASSQKWLSPLKSDGKQNKFMLPYRWRWLLDTRYDCHNKCCTFLKKEPFKHFEKTTGRSPILGMMATESQQRKGIWVKNGGCNAFDNKRQSSWPLAIFTEADIWAYIKKFNIQIPEIYYQGASRSGCVCCGYGIHNDDDNRLEMLYNNYPKLYEMFMNYENNGITYRTALRDVLATVGKFLPDETPR